MHISGELCLLFFKLAAPCNILFFKVARSPFKQKYGNRTFFSLHAALRPPPQQDLQFGRVCQREEDQPVGQLGLPPVHVEGRRRGDLDRRQGGLRVHRRLWQVHLGQIRSFKGKVRFFA